MAGDQIAYRTLSREECAGTAGLVRGEAATRDYSSLPRRLLILACSASKRPGVEPMPARDRYDGPLWKTLRAVDPNGELARVAFLSAEYGFGPADTGIPDYNLKLTRDASRMMVADAFNRTAGIAGLAGYGREPMEDVALVGGRDYIAVMRAAVPALITQGCVLPGARITVINAAFGFMRQEMRNWLLETTSDPHLAGTAKI